MTKKYLFSFALLWGGIALYSWNFQSAYFRPWEKMRAVEWNFKKNLQVKMIKKYGDHAHVTGLRHLSQPREVSFTSDQYGFRNKDSLGAVDIVVLGDSFVAGCGLDDNETLTHHLSQLLNKNVYNYAGLQFVAPKMFVADERFKKQPPKLVIWSPAATNIPFIYSKYLSQAPEKESEIEKVVDEINRFKKSLDRDNLLSRQSKRAVSEFYRYFYQRPGLSKDMQYIEFEDEQKIVLSLERQGLYLEPERMGLRQIVSSIKYLKDHLKKQGIDFIYAPIPTSAYVYVDQFTEEDRAKIYRNNIYDAVMNLLKHPQVNVKSLDLRPTFIKNRSPYLFLADDTHWNGRGSHVAARALADFIKKTN